MHCPKCDGIALCQGYRPYITPQRPCPHTNKQVHCQEITCQDCPIEAMAERVAALDDFHKNVAGGN